MAVRVVEIPEVKVDGKPLGRHIEHDDRSWDYRYAAEPRTLANVTHDRMIPILDQGDLGSCTGNAGTGALGTRPLAGSGDGVVLTTLDESYAVQLYSDATKVDTVSGSYPPDDTGSSGLAIAKVLKTRGIIDSYQHTFSSSDALTALQDYPLLIGANWLTDMDNPDAQGTVKFAGTVRGGHEFVAMGYVDGYVIFANSWGTSWGLNGTFRMTEADFGKMLAAQGDVIVLIPKSAGPAPTPDPTPTPVPVPVPTPTPVPVPTPTPVSDTQFMQDWLSSKPFFYKSFQKKLASWLQSREDNKADMKSYLEYEHGEGGNKG